MCHSTHFPCVDEWPCKLNTGTISAEEYNKLTEEDLAAVHYIYWSDGTVTAEKRKNEIIR